MVSEIALAVILAVGATLMVRSFLGLQKVDPGFRPEGILTAKVSLPLPRYPEASRRIRVLRPRARTPALHPGRAVGGYGQGLIAAAPLAGYLPARRAARVEPVLALRCE